MPYDHPETLTYSKLSSFACPLRFKLLHVDGLRDESDPARRGSTVHTASEFYIQALVEAGMESDPDLAQEALKSAIASESTPAHLVPDCEDVWQNHVERFTLDLGAFLEAEKRRTVGGMSFKADIVYARPDSLDILDIKTHFVGLTEAGAKADFQARTYCYLARESWPNFPRYTFTFLFPRLRTSVTATFEPAELDKVGRQLEAHALALQEARDKDEWPAAPGSQCQYCAFKCEAVDDARREPTRLLTMADAEKTAGDLAILKQAVALKTRVLSAYAGINGPVVQGGMEWSHRPTETLKFPAGQVCDELHALGVDYSKLTLGRTALKSWLTARKWAHVAKALLPLAMTTQSTRFSAKKLGVVDDEEEDDRAVTP